MPTFTILPNGGSVRAAVAAAWDGTFADIDEGVNLHDSDMTTMSATPPLSGDANASDLYRIEFEVSTLPATKAKVRVVHRHNPTTEFDFLVLYAALYIGDTFVAAVRWYTGGGYTPFGDVDARSEVPLSTSFTEHWFETNNSGNGFTAAQVSDLNVNVQVWGDPLGGGIQHLITAVEVVLDDSSGSGGADNASTVTVSDEVQAEDNWWVSGSGSTSSPPTVTDEVQVEDAWTVALGPTGGGSGQVETGRTDIACRGCGTFFQITENLIFYTDGLGKPQTWDGAAATATDVTGAKELPYGAALRGRVFLFGAEPYRTGTVQTTAGITQIIASATWPATVLGKGIAIEGVTFGADARCNTHITVINGTLATLAQAPNQSFAAQAFTVFGGTAGSMVQWCEENDHQTWTAAIEEVGRLDGDIETGCLALGQVLLMFKRQHTYRLDYDQDPDTAVDGVITPISETRGLVANKSAVVLDGVAYLMDQSPEGYFWATRGAAGFPLNLGRRARAKIEKDGEFEIDFNKSSCWFAWYSPEADSICWACTRKGQPYPDIAIEYFRPNIEGGEEPGRWWIREYHHYILMAVNAVDADGVLRAFIQCADRDDTATTWTGADSNTYGDLAKIAQTGTVAAHTVGTKIYDLGAHTKIQKGSLLEINGQTRTVTLDDDAVNVTVSKEFTVETVGQKWRSGYRPRCRWRSISISPDPPWGMVHLDQVWVDAERPNADSEVKVTVRSEKTTQQEVILGGASSESGTVRSEERVTKIAFGTRGYNVDVEVELLSPDGKDVIHSMDIIRRKEEQPPGHLPSE